MRRATQSETLPLFFYWVWIFVFLFMCVGELARNVQRNSTACVESMRVNAGTNVETTPQEDFQLTESGKTSGPNGKNRIGLMNVRHCDEIQAMKRRQKYTRRKVGKSTRQRKNLPEKERKKQTIMAKLWCESFDECETKRTVRLSSCTFWLGICVSPRVSHSRWRIQMSARPIVLTLPRNNPCIAFAFLSIRTDSMIVMDRNCPKADMLFASFELDKWTFSPAH